MTTATQPLIGDKLSDVIPVFEKQEKDLKFIPFTSVALNKDKIDFNCLGKPVHSAPVTSEYWLKYFCNVARTPFSYINTLTPQLKLELVQHHMPTIDQSRFTFDGTRALAHDTKNGEFSIVSKFRQYMKPSELLQMYATFFKDKGETTVHRYSPSIDNPQFSILNEEWNMSFMNSDVAYFGLSVDWNSNFIFPKVFGSSHRPVCGNLMCVPRNIGRINMSKKLNESAAINRFHQAGQRAINHVNNVLIPQLQTSTTKTFSDLVAFLEQMKVSKEIRELIVKAFLEEKGNTIYHIIQACTYATTHYDLTDEEIQSLEKVVLFLLNLSSEDVDTCQLCHRTV